MGVFEQGQAAQQQGDYLKALHASCECESTSSIQALVGTSPVVCAN